ncbi:hypothetical protein M0812_21594 [Anaeramoeba flamelloides]|uniref:Protein kinase domain-containing protein n=1 Tax=Anaeramoeba flamelloides TaxID=1746091 RepID=A0AAV7YV15_9EUKA|nr:hypothetical protein M0812_21594 [Anaeramoeba flamelloides]
MTKIAFSNHLYDPNLVVDRSAKNQNNKLTHPIQYNLFSRFRDFKIEREGKNAPVKVKESKIVSVTRDQSTKMINDYQIIGSLGKGSYGKVKKAKRGNEFYAIKIMNKRLLKKKKKRKEKNCL